MSGAGALHFQDVTVVPFSDLMDEPNGGREHRGGPCWPDFAAQTGARHNRRGQPRDVEPETAAEAQELAGPMAWGGPIYSHFGHQVSEFSMRLIPTLAYRPDARICFASHPRYGYATLQDTPGHFRQILDWVGLLAERTLIIARPARMGELFVLPQAEQLYGPGPSEAHLDLMDAFVEQRLHPGTREGAVFVSRAGVPNHLAGEAYIERLVAGCGVRVMRPESLPLTEQLSVYATTRTLVFTGGSANTTTQLLGRNLGEVVVLMRHATDRPTEASLRPRSRSLAYLDVLAGVVHGMRPDGLPALLVGQPVPDAERLLTSLSDMLPRLRDIWDQAAFERARDADVLEWLERGLRAPFLRSEASWAHMLGTLEECGLGHLRAEVESMMESQSDGGRLSQPMAAVPARPHPQPWSPRRLNRLAALVDAHAYLEIGVGAGHTLRAIEVPERTGVDPRSNLESADLDGSGIRLVTSTSDEFFAGLDPGETFDLVYVDGLHTFEQAYRDLCSALLHAHARSLILLDDTLPVDVYSNLHDREAAIAARKAAGGAGDAWHGDVFKVVFALHDFHLGLAWATITGSGKPQTLVWRASGEERTPLFDSLEAISRLDYFDLLAHRDILRPMGEEEAMALCAGALAR